MRNEDIIKLLHEEIETHKTQIRRLEALVATLEYETKNQVDANDKLNNKVYWTMNEVANHLGLLVADVESMSREEGFPLVTINGKRCINAQKLKKWLDKNEKQGTLKANQAVRDNVESGGKRESVAQYTRSGKLKKVFNSESEAAEETGLPIDAIHNACTFGTQAGGFFWSYKE